MRAYDICQQPTSLSDWITVIDVKWSAHASHTSRVFCVCREGNDIETICVGCHTVAMPMSAHPTRTASSCGCRKMESNAWSRGMYYIYMWHSGCSSSSSRDKDFLSRCIRKDNTILPKRLHNCTRNGTSTSATGGPPNESLSLSRKEYVIYMCVYERMWDEFMEVFFISVHLYLSYMPNWVNPHAHICKSARFLARLESDQRCCKHVTRHTAHTNTFALIKWDDKYRSGKKQRILF